MVISMLSAALKAICFNVGIIGETEHGDKVYGYAPDENEPEPSP